MRAASRAVFAFVNLVGEDVVVPQPCPRCDTGHVSNADAIDDGSLPGHAGGDPRCVSPVPLDCVCIGSLIPSLIVEDFSHNDLWRDVLTVLVLVIRIAICGVAFRKARGITKTSWVKEGMCLKYARVDISNLNSCSRI